MKTCISAGNRAGATIARALAAFVLILVCAANAPAQSAAPAPAATPLPEGDTSSSRIAVWPEGQIPDRIEGGGNEVATPGHVSNVQVPQMYAYPLPGVTPAPPAVIVFPGGGYKNLSIDKEGHDVARWLNSLGIAAFVLKYRHAPYKHPVPMQDALKAIYDIRTGAAALNVDPHRIGIWGFSAGGHLAATVLTAPNDNPVARPDFAILGYPVINLSEATLVHAGSRDNLLGPGATREQTDALSADLRASADCPPTFLFHAKDDKAVPVENSIRMDAALKTAGVKSTLYLSEFGGHGFGLHVMGANAALQNWLVKMGLTIQAPAAFTPEEEKAAFELYKNGGAPAAGPNAAKARVFIAGDSLACAYPPDRAPRMGWGQLLQEYFDPDLAEVVNMAKSGRSSKSFIDEGELAKIAKELRKGDYLLIQFGHNDQKKEDALRYTDPKSSFPKTLQMYIDAARSAGAQPVLLTSVVRRKFKGGTLSDTHGEYLTAVRKLASSQKVPLIDIAEGSRKYFEAMGEEATKQYFLHLAPGASPNYPQGVEDNTHLQQKGAEAMASMVAEGIIGLNLPLKNKMRKDLVIKGELSGLVTTSQ